MQHRARTGEGQHVDVAMAATMLDRNERAGALQAQVSEAGLGVGELRSVQDFASSEWAHSWGAVVEVDDRAGGTLRMPGAPWRFGATPPTAHGVPRLLGESNEQMLADLGHPQDETVRLTRAGVLKQATVPGAP